MNILISNTISKYELPIVSYLSIICAYSMFLINVVFIMVSQPNIVMKRKETV